MSDRDARSRAEGAGSETEALLRSATMIRRGATALATRARVERRGELTLNQTGILGLLARTDVLTPTELMERLHVSLASLARTLGALQADGLITRMPDPGDRRQSMVALTEAGRAALRLDMRPRDEWIAGVLAEHTTPTERELLVVAARLMERLGEIDLFPGTSEP